MAGFVLQQLQAFFSPKHTQHEVHAHMINVIFNISGQCSVIQPALLSQAAAVAALNQYTQAARGPRLIRDMSDPGGLLLTLHLHPTPL